MRWLSSSARPRSQPRRPLHVSQWNGLQRIEIVSHCALSSTAAGRCASCALAHGHHCTPRGPCGHARVCSQHQQFATGTPRAQPLPPPAGCNGGSAAASIAASRLGSSGQCDLLLGVRQHRPAGRRPGRRCLHPASANNSTKCARVCCRQGGAEAHVRTDGSRASLLLGTWVGDACDSTCCACHDSFEARMVVLSVE